VICKLTVWPGVIFEGFTNVSEPLTNVNVKKLAVDKSKDAVLEAILNPATLPFKLPVTIGSFNTAI